MLSTVMVMVANTVAAVGMACIHGGSARNFAALCSIAFLQQVNCIMWLHVCTWPNGFMVLLVLCDQAWIINKVKC